MPAVTIPVSDLPIADKPVTALDTRASLVSMLRLPVEDMAVNAANLVCCNDAHPFAQAAHDAFYDHYPLTISPDDVWFCLAQGFAQHVGLHAEELRHHFVRHEGKLKLLVNRPDFILGQPNPWPEVFGAFSEQITAHVGRDLRDLLIADFTTTTLFHRSATEVAMMDAFQPYFEYEVMAGCGIPAITLTGAPDDWRDVRRRAAAFAQYGLEEWVAALLPVLDRIEASSRGHHDREFWNSFFRYQSGSGGSALTGWIHVLFPYLKNYRDEKVPIGALVPNPYLQTWQADCAHAINSRGKGRWKDYEEISGPALLEIPAGVASAPVRVIDGHTDETHEMKFVAGMFGVAQDPVTRGLAPVFGWAILYDKLVPLPKPPRWRMTQFRE